MASVHSFRRRSPAGKEGTKNHHHFLHIIVALLFSLYVRKDDDDTILLLLMEEERRRQQRRTFLMRRRRKKILGRRDTTTTHLGGGVFLRLFFCVSFYVVFVSMGLLFFRLGFVDATRRADTIIIDDGIVVDEKTLRAKATTISTEEEDHHHHQRRRRLSQSSSLRREEERTMMSNSEFQLSSDESSGRKEEDFDGRKDFGRKERAAILGREEDQRDQKPPGCVTRDEAFGIELTIATGGNSAMEGIDGTTLFALSALFGTDIADDNNKNVFVDDDEKDEKDEYPRASNEEDVVGPIQLATPKDVNMSGCEARKDTDALEYKNKCVVIKRGGCSFETKARIAQNKGAKCAIIVSDGEELGSMTCDSDLSVDIPVMNVIEKDGKMLTTAYELGGSVEMRKLKDGIDFYGNGALLSIAVLSITLGAIFSVTDRFYSSNGFNGGGVNDSSGSDLNNSASSNNRSNSASPSQSNDNSPNRTLGRQQSREKKNNKGGSYGTTNEEEDQPLMVGGGDEESGQQHQQQRRQRSGSRRGTSRRRRQQHSSAPDEDERGFEITEMSAVYFVLFSSLVLVVLFYSMDHWIFVAFRLLFCLAALQGLSVMLFELIARIFGVDPHKSSYDHTPLSSNRRRSSSRSRSQEENEEASAVNKRIKENNANFILVPFFGNVHYLMIPSVIIGGILVCVWLMFQSEEWAWVLQDVMGVAFLVNVMRLVHLPNLKIATLLLVCAMSYDIFWVYVQPHLFGKESVMVNVARGGDKHESLPMLFMFPRIGGTQGEYSMLGYGDVILPGLLIVHNALFENRFYSLHSSSSSEGTVKKMRYKYFVWSIFAYSVGMILTFVALYLKVGGQGGQPALTYLVPTTVLTTVCVAWTNGELREMWDGSAASSHSGRRYVIPTGETEGLL